MLGGRFFLRHSVYRITHGCGCILPEYCTPTQCQSHSRAVYFSQNTRLRVHSTRILHSNTVPEPLSSQFICHRQFGHASRPYLLPLRRPKVEPTTSIAYWPDQSVCHKQTGETVAQALCLRVQYPGRLQSQPCVMLYIVLSYAHELYS